MRQKAEQQRKARAILRTGDRLFRLLVDSVRDHAIIVLDPDGHVVRWNAGAEQIEGYSVDEIMGEHFSCFYPLEDIASGKPSHDLAEAVAHGRFEDEGWRLRKDGTRFWANVVITALRDVDGRLVGFAQVVRDLTERRRAEAELRAANAELVRRAEELQAANLKLQTFGLVVTSVVDYAIFVLDPVGRVSSWNAGAERIKGYSADEILGQHFSRFYPLEDIEAGKPAIELREAAATGRFEDEGWRLRKDGSRFWASVVLTALRDDGGRLVGFAKVTRDLTERKRAEEERAALVAREQSAQVEAAAARRTAFLAEASRVLATSFDYRTTLQRVAELAVPEVGDWCLFDVVTPDGSLERIAIATADPESVKVAWELQRRFPPQPDDAAGPAAVVRTGIPEMAEKVSDTLLASVARHPGHAKMLRRLRLRSYVCVPLVARGAPLGALTLLRTGASVPFRRVDLELAQDLGHRVALALDNARHFQEAQEAIRVRDEFLAIASHELRTPLTPLYLHMQGLVRALRGGKPADLAPERIATALESADRQVRRFKTLVEELLDVSRIASGRLTLELEEVDLGELARTLVARFETELARAGSTATLTVEGPVVGRWDRLRVEQVLTNLLSNAIKYGAGRPIEMRLAPHADAVEVVVRDHGIGIGPEDRARIFERFERAAPSRHYGGLGMGLYIARQIVEAHGGSIGVESEGPDRGSTFTVRLPRGASRGQAA